MCFSTSELKERQRAHPIPLYLRAESSIVYDTNAYPFSTQFFYVRKP